MNQKGFSSVLILVGILILAVALIGGAYYFRQSINSEQKACTLEAMICPDGSSVGRSGPKCEFAACPTQSSNTSPLSEISKLRECPEEWIVNKMPGTVEDQEPTPREYFIFDNKRREISEFDVDWIKSNCSVIEPSPVY